MTFQFDQKKQQVVPSENSGKAAHDVATPPALVHFMLRNWKSIPRPIAKLKNAEAFARRRHQLSQLFPGDVLVIPTGHEKVRSNDTNFRFRPGSDFYYLTGNTEPDCVLILDPLEGGGHRDIAFVEPNPGRSDATFYTDRSKGELWVGPRLGVEQSRIRYQVHECRGLPELPAFIDSLKSRKASWRLARGLSDKIEQLLPAQQKQDIELAVALAEMRLIKDELEVRELSAAVASTRNAFEDVIRALRKAKSERVVEGVFQLRARVEGNDVGYGTIAAAGAHACTLHWTRNNGELKRGALLLLDAGVERESLYTADITRTVPLSGKFSREQREIYSLVHSAQAAAFKAVKPGNDFMEPNREAMKVLAHGLERLGILEDATVALSEENQFYKRYSLHNVSHMLGIDVHDCAQARQEAYKFGKLRPGMVLTVEPGLYFQVDDLTVPAKYRGIGVRIEDDVVVTERGYRNLSKNIPSEPSEVEAWMARLWKGA